MNEYMNRPMFQTPQMREGAGIMAGIAPVRGYADGDEVNDDDRSERLTGALSNLVDLGVDKYQGGTKFLGDVVEQMIRGGVNIADSVGDSIYDMSPEDLQTIINVLGEYSEDIDLLPDELTPALEEDFFRLTTDSAHKKAVESGEDTEGLPMNLQDLTDIVFDPDNPVDLGLLTLAATPTGIGNIAGITGKVGQAGGRINKLTGGVGNLLDRLTGMTGSASKKSNPIGTGERYGRLVTTASAPDLLDMVSSENLNEYSESFVDAMEEAESKGYANGGIATLKARDGVFVDMLSSLAPFLGKIAGGAKRTLFGKPTKINDALPEPVTSPITSTKTKKTKGDNKEKEEEVTTTTTVTDDVIEEDFGMPKKRSNLSKLAKYGVGGAGLIWIGNKLFNEETNEEVDVTKLAPENIPPKPQIIDSSVMNTEQDVQNLANELTEENRSWTDKTLDRLKGVAGNALDRLDDPRVRAGIMAAAKPVEGYTPVNALVAASEGARQYDLEQAQLSKLSEDAKSDLQQQFELIRPLVKGYEGQSEEEIDRMVFQSLFDRSKYAQDMEILLTLNKVMPNAPINIDDLNKYRDSLGGVDISALLAPRKP